MSVLKHGEQFVALEHWNKKILLAIDIRTNGPDATEHDITEIGAVFVDIDGTIISGQLPFSVTIATYSQGTLTDAAFAKISEEGTDPDKARDIFMNWLDTSVISKTKWGNKRQAMLLGYDITDKYNFLQAYLGDEFCAMVFHETKRDIRACAMFINDVHAYLGEPVRFVKYTYPWLMQHCCNLSVPLRVQSDCISRAYGAAAMYMSMVKYHLKPIRQC